MTDSILKHKQLFAHDPENGVFGDCQRTVIACLLKLPVEAVPHDHEPGNSVSQLARMNAFLKQHGAFLINVPIAAETLDDALSWAAERTEHPYCIAGQSVKGCNHVVIAQGRSIIWDTSGSGITGPCDHGYFEIDFLVRPL